MLHYNFCSPNVQLYVDCIGRRRSSNRLVDWYSAAARHRSSGVHCHPCLDASVMSPDSQPQRRPLCNFLCKENRRHPERYRWIAAATGDQPSAIVADVLSPVHWSWDTTYRHEVPNKVMFAGSSTNLPSTRVHWPISTVRYVTRMVNASLAQGRLPL